MGVVVAENGAEVYTDQIEPLFMEFCENCGALKEVGGTVIADPVKATAAWSYIYTQLFKPDMHDLRYNNKSSKLDYKDIYTISSVLDIYESLCMRFKLPPYQKDFCRLTGISRDTLNSWEHGEYRMDDSGSLFKHSDIAKRIRDLRGELLEKRLWEDPIGRQSLANNSETFGLMYNRQNINNQATAQIAIRSAKEIAAAHRHVLDEPEPERPIL